MGLRSRDARPFCCAKSRRVTRGAAAHFRCACALGPRRLRSRAPRAFGGLSPAGCTQGPVGCCARLQEVSCGKRRHLRAGPAPLGTPRAASPGDGPGRARQRRGLGTAPPAREGGVPLGLRQGQLEGRQAGLGSGVRLNPLSTTGSISGSAPSAGRFQGPHETWPGDTAARLRRERRGRGPQRRSQHELRGAVCVDG